MPRKKRSVSMLVNQVSDPDLRLFMQEAKESSNKIKENDKLKRIKLKEIRSKRYPTLKWGTLGPAEHEEKDTLAAIITNNESPAAVKESRLRCTIVHSEGEDSFTESSSESEEESSLLDTQIDSPNDLVAEHWQILKLSRFLKGGNQVATVIALCNLQDFDLNSDIVQHAVKDTGCLEILINLLESDVMKCKVGSLKVLRSISTGLSMHHAIADLGGVQTLVNVLRKGNKVLKALSAETIANICTFRRARRTVRQEGGIRLLVKFLQNYPSSSTNPKEIANDKALTFASSQALAKLCVSKRNKYAMAKHGVLPIIGKLLKISDDIVVPIMAILCECVTEPYYAQTMRNLGMIEDIVGKLFSSNLNVQKHAASTVYFCANDAQTRDLARLYGALDPLVTLLSMTQYPDVVRAASGAIWKCSINNKKTQNKLKEMEVLDVIVNLLNTKDQNILINVVGVLAELCSDQSNRASLKKQGGIALLMELLPWTNTQLLVNVCDALEKCAYDREILNMITDMDGVKLIWSLLKNPDQRVQAAAARAITPCVEFGRRSGDMVRSFVGGLELIVHLLAFDENELPLSENKKKVLTGICAAIARIAKDEENLAVITDHGVVKMLSDLCITLSDVPRELELKSNLADAIASCCSWGNNREMFGYCESVLPLVSFLKTKDINLQRSITVALYQLSKHPNNCVVLHSAKSVVPKLLHMVGSPDVKAQEAAAGSLANLRRLAIANEHTSMFLTHDRTVIKENKAGQESTQSYLCRESLKKKT